MSSYSPMSRIKLISIRCVVITRFGGRIVAYFRDSNVFKGLQGERWLNNSLKGLGYKTHPNKLKEGEYSQQIGKRVDNWFVLPNGHKIELEMKYFGERSNLYGEKYEQQVKAYFDPRKHVTKILVITFPNVPVKRCQQDHINVFHIDSDLTTKLKRLIARRKLRKYLRAIINNVTRNIISRKNFLALQLDKFSKLVRCQPVKQPNITIKNNTQALSKVIELSAYTTAKTSHKHLNQSQTREQATSTNIKK